MGEQLRLEDAPGYSTLRLTGPAPTVQARPQIVELRAAGQSWSSVARTLNARGVPTPTGRGMWWPESVRRHVDPAPWRDYIRRYRIRTR